MPAILMSYPWADQTVMIFSVVALVVIIAIILGWRVISRWFNRNRLRYPRSW